MLKKVELLAPAGNYDAFLAAVENGADAVYLGGKLLNARQFAGNFDDEELQKAIDYAHVRGVKILLTLNTLVLDEEMQEAVEYAIKAYEMGVDAFIVQDMGLVSNLKGLMPQIPLHASTQMTTYNFEGVRALEKAGFERVVLARELEIHEISEICKNTALEIEVFIHGALCISYSGQCLMSSLIGGRSGNRGKCAQPCRMHYSMTKDGNNIKSSYLLSPKDICHIDHLADLINAGVASFKIEGRMKSPEYVATVVSTYRKYLDLLEQERAVMAENSDNAQRVQLKNPKVSGPDRHSLLQSFNRGGFSKGYLLGKTGPDMMAYHKPKNWGTYLGTALAQDRSTNSVKLKLENTLGNGDGIEIWSGKTYEESPGGIITKIVLDGGKQVKRANSGDTVWVSVIRGNIEKGSKVYKTSDKEMLEQAAATYAKPSRKVDIKAAFTMRADELPEITLFDFDGNIVSVKGEVLPDKAVNKPLTGERVSEQLKKMGSTPFNVVELQIDMDKDIVLPISELNNIRRKAAELLEKKRIISGKPYYSINGQEKNSQRELTNTQYDKAESQHDLTYFQREFTYFPGNTSIQLGNMSSSYGNMSEDHGNVLNSSENAAETVKDSVETENRVKLSAMFYHLNKNLELDKVPADRLYVHFNDILDNATAGQINNARKSGKEVFAYVPAVIKGKQTDLLNKNAGIIYNRTDGFLVGNMGVGELLKSSLGEKVKLMGDYTLNLLNSSTSYYFKESGYSGAALSYELNLSQLLSLLLPEDFETELGVYGRIPVMTSEYCPVGGSAGNAAPHKCRTECKNGVFHLKDRKNAAFLVKCDCVDCRSTIFNSDILFAPELMDSIMKTGMKYIRMSFVDESIEEIYDIVNFYKDLIMGRKNTDQGRKVIEYVKSKGITKGHLQRGV